MADLAITANQVIPGTQASFLDGRAASAITAGQPLYKNSSGLYAPAQADGTFTEATVVGIATHAAAANQPIRLQNGGRLTLGAAAAPVSGRVYVLSPTAGAWNTVDDVLFATGHFTVVLGVGVGSNAVDLLIYANSLSVRP